MSHHQIIFIRFGMEGRMRNNKSALEDGFDCQVDIDKCPSFSGEFDIQELRRIFDNLSSNIEKYGDNNMPVVLQIFEKDKRLHLEQKNHRKKMWITWKAVKSG